MPEITARVPGGCGAGLRPLMPPSSVLHQAPGPLSRTGQLLLSPLGGNIPTTSQQHPNISIMLHVVCDLVLCPPAMFRTRIVSVMLLQLGAEF